MKCDRVGITDFILHKLLNIKAIESESCILWTIQMHPLKWIKKFYDTLTFLTATSTDGFNFWYSNFSLLICAV